MTDTARPMGKVTAFPDTNVLLHAQALKQIDWRSLLGAEEVELAIARVVFDELDRKKYDPRLKERARRANAQLQEILEAGGRLAEGVRLSLVFGELDNAELKSHGLIWDHGDDRLIGCALKFGGGARKGVVVVSMDNGLLNRAPSNGLEAVRLPEKYRAPTGQDPTEADNKKLRDRVAELEEQHPRLTLEFANGERERTVEIPIQVENDVALLYVREWAQAQGYVMGAIPDLGMRGMYSAHEAEDSAAFWNFARAQERAEQAMARCEGIKLRLRNEGRHPARSVRVWIDVPEVVEAVNPRIEFPREPQLRPSPIVGQPLMVTYMRKFRDRSIAMRAPDKSSTLGVMGPLGTEQGGTIAFKIDAIEDLDVALLPEFHLLFRGGELPEVVKLPYKAVASGVPIDFEGELTLRIRRLARVPPAPPA
jgi:hypothetical protein